MISKRLLVASLAACWLPVPIVAARTTATGPKQSYDQLLQAAETARNDNRSDEAVVLFRRAVAEHPESEEALWYLGTLYYEKQQYGQARDVLRQFMTLRDDAGPGWAVLGICEFKLREYPRALDHLQRAMAQGIGDSKELVEPVLYDLMVLLTRFERYDESLALLAYGQPDSSFVEPAGLAGLRLPLLPSELPPDRRELVDVAGRAVFAMETERYGEAEAGFKQLIAEFPKEPGVHFLYGAFLALQHPDQAEPEFERELEISPSHVLARVRLAERMIARQEYDSALELAQQAIQLDPKRASAHAFAGEALIGKGKLADGIKELEIARAADPSVSKVHWDLMRAYSTVGRKDDAVQEKQEVEKLLRNKPISLGEAAPQQDSPAK
ncbi:MAG TPA: tetratricopeptide repeat protein [Terracidiphilus sp.]|nr:tetratricopeptide repeat protein [Terracidiphilus sp.]